MFSTIFALGLVLNKSFRESRAESPRDSGRHLGQYMLSMFCESGQHKVPYQEVCYLGGFIHGRWGL